ncbi:S41 family peptidase [Robiginitalea sp. IMCC43444]|uniref:S41 family peptidase n=1 Tax=Robiginitalea sp. IMCC43444 TaxID=3459121 RepID=UPI004041315B
MKRGLKIFLISTSVVFLIFVLLGVAFYKRFVVYPPDPEFREARDMKEAQQQDLDYLALYQNYDKSLDTPEKRNAFNTVLKETSGQLPLSRGAFEMAVSRALATADNAHTNTSAGARARRLNAVPLRFYWFEEGLYIILAYEGYEELLGKRVDSINGFTPDSLLKKLKPWYGGPAEALKDRSPLFFMSPEVLHATGLGKSPDTLHLYYKNKTDLIHAAIPISEEEKDVPGYWPAYWLNPFSRIAESNWKSCIKQGISAAPFSELETNVNHRTIGSTMYVQVNENTDSPDRKLRKYLRNVQREMENGNYDKAVLDLRFNPGGNYRYVNPFIEFLDKKFTDGQQVYLITGNGTFSAGIITAAYAQKILGEKVIILGESVGDRLQFWADGGAKMVLPNSKISLRIWTAYNDWENGCEDLSKCFWITYFIGIAAGELRLDKEIQLYFSDYQNGKDTSLEYILKR